MQLMAAGSFWANSASAARIATVCGFGFCAAAISKKPMEKAFTPAGPTLLRLAARSAGLVGAEPAKRLELLCVGVGPPGQVEWRLRERDQLRLDLLRSRVWCDCDPEMPAHPVGEALLAGVVEAVAAEVLLARARASTLRGERELVLEQRAPAVTPAQRYRRRRRSEVFPEQAR